jgi:hypothetical protein
VGKVTGLYDMQIDIMEQGPRSNGFAQLGKALDQKNMRVRSHCLRCGSNPLNSHGRVFSQSIQVTLGIQNTVRGCLEVQALHLRNKFTEIHADNQIIVRDAGVITLHEK